jgi:hypothetical protein
MPPVEPTLPSLPLSPSLQLMNAVDK